MAKDVGQQRPRLDLDRPRLPVDRERDQPALIGHAAAPRARNPRSTRTPATDARYAPVACRSVPARSNPTSPGGPRPTRRRRPRARAARPRPPGPEPADRRRRIGRPGRRGRRHRQRPGTGTPRPARSPPVVGPPPRTSRPPHPRERHAGDQLIGIAGRPQRALEEVLGGHDPLAAGRAPERDRTVQRDQDGGELGGRVGVGEAPPDRGPVPDLEGGPPRAGRPPGRGSPRPRPNRARGRRPGS